MIEAPPIDIGGTNGLLVSAFISSLSGLGSGPGQGHCVVFLCKTLCSTLTVPHYPDVQIGISLFNAGSDPVMD